MLALLTVQWSSPARSRCQVEAQLTLLLQQICLLISALVEWMISHPCSRLKEKRWVPGLSGTQHRIVDNKKKTQETHCGVAPQIWGPQAVCPLPSSFQRCSMIICGIISRVPRGEEQRKRKVSLCHLVLEQKGYQFFLLFFPVLSEPVSTYKICMAFPNFAFVYLHFCSCFLPEKPVSRATNWSFCTDENTNI